MLTITNPMTILSFAAVFAGLGIANAGQGHLPGALLVSGVFAGSCLWWLLLSGGVGLFRNKLDAHRLQWINRAAGLVIGAFAALAIASALR